ncbi:glycosyl phosphatidylinositol synthesis [Scheffersomyces xylosifermentans]|uniref:glycosyl phosphatidylinositol synthesis n=1 Tax=Scheffersomyces xylosifermentans TaxID=1304137 RepID=UPI00315D0511
MSDLWKRRGGRRKEDRVRTVEEEIKELEVDTKRISESYQVDSSRPAIKNSALFVGIFAIRLINALTIRTFFQPDEYFQALEPAHHYAFGYGYITWEWREQLRSSIHPLIYALGYKAVSLIPNNDQWVEIVPKVIGALIATIGEVSLYKFSQKYANDEAIARITLLLSVFNPFNWYVSTRSFSNSFETALTTVALRYWPWNNEVDYKSYVLSIAIALITCIVRPTNSIIWIFLGLHYLFQLRKRFYEVSKIISITIIEAVVIFSASTLLDYSFYGQLTFPLYNFLEFNIVKKLSIFYGVAPWHFYIFQAIPLFLMLYLPFLLHSLLVLKKYQSVLCQAGLVYLLAFSCIDHKEFRFVYPLQPILLLLCAYSFKVAMKSPTFFIYAINVVVVVNTLISYFFTRIQERGVIDVIDYIKNDSTVKSVGFLTPCHSTPWQSQLHRPDFEANAWFLTCEPPLHLTSGNRDEILQYRDESDQFYDNRTQFLHENFPIFGEDKEAAKHKKYDWPSHLVIFQAEEDFMTDFLAMSNYRQCQRFFNSYFHWDSRRSGDVIVYCDT